jgi:hypothetical protein
MRRLALATAALAAATAVAMHITTVSRVMAWSRDGVSALISDDAHGPEGGGSEGVRVVCGGPSVNAKLSSDFSPGGSSRPQRISEDECRASVQEVANAVARRGFDGVTASPEGCKKRQSMVTSSSNVGQSLPSGWKLTMRGTTLLISEKDKVVLEVPNAARARVSPTAKTLVVFSEEYGQPVFTGAWTRDAKGVFVQCENSL